MQIRQFFKGATCVFYPKGIQNIFWKTIDFVKNLEMTQIVGGEGSCSLRHYSAMSTKIDMCSPLNQ